MVTEGPQEGPPGQGPEGRGGKEAEQTGAVKQGSQKSVGEKRLSVRDPVLCKSLCVAGVSKHDRGTRGDEDLREDLNMT